MYVCILAGVTVRAYVCTQVDSETLSRFI
jgi:hypothetical protein